MKKVILIFLALLLAFSCQEPNFVSPYSRTLCALTVRAAYPDGFDEFIREGVAVKVEEVNLGHNYTVYTDISGQAFANVPTGLYRISISDNTGEDIFNATADKVILNTRADTISLDLLHSKAGSLVIKELYVGGCKKLPQEGNFNYDKYMIVHNNHYAVQYLDSLCVGSLIPYNATATNPFISKDAEGKTIFPDCAHISEAIWQIGGDGHTFPLQPGEDAVICLNSTVDNTIQYPLSVNLNKPEYFVTYNNNFFGNTNYHPVPGSNTRPDHILEVVTKLGVANAFAFSMNSPAAVIYRAKGTTMTEYVNTADAIIPIPGVTTGAKTAKIPYEWILDAVEVFDGASSANAKRLPAVVDAGYVYQSDTYLGVSIFRKTDEELTKSSGYEVLRDTNNSTEDMYERETASLHE